MGRIILNGAEDPALLRSAIRVVGRRLIEDVPSTARVTISSVALTLSGFCSCIFFIASSAKGVAAFPIPSIFALSAAVISCFAQPVRQAFGKTWRSMGDNILLSFSISPALRSTSIIPHQRHILPARVKVSWTDAEAPSRAALDSSVIFPVKAAQITETAHSMKKHFPSMILPRDNRFILNKILS